MIFPRLLVITLALFSSGCATPPAGVPWNASGWGPVTIISDPPGAKIEVNGEYWGETPLQSNVWYSGSWWVMRIVAYPVVPGQYSHSKVIMVPPIPRTIYFNMNMKPAPEEQDITIRQR
jgi:hypothetical protein